MKRIVISLFLLISISAFSQSEIWGTKYHAGKKNGGVLFSIDSATNQIITQHRFEHYNYQINTVDVPPFYDEEKNVWLIAERNQILVYYPAIDLIESIDYEGSIYLEEGIYGKFCKGLDDQYYIFHKKGLLKIDISKKETYLLKSEYQNSIDGGAEFSRIDNKLYWPLNTHNDLLIYSLDIQNDSIELLYYKDQNLNLLGKLNYLHGKFYGSYETGGHFVIYSFDLIQDEFNIEKEIPLVGYFDGTGLQLASDQKLYAAGEVESDFDIQLFSYDPISSDVQFLTSYQNPNGLTIKPYFFAQDEHGFYLQFEKKYNNNNGSILRYDFNSDSLQEIFSYSQNLHFSSFLSTQAHHVFTIHSKADYPYGQYLYNFNLLDGTIDTLKKVLTPKFTNGFYPKKIIQLENGLIIGNTSAGGTYDGDEYHYISNSGGILFQFDPLTKDYKVLIDFTKDFPDYTGSGTIYNLAGNDFLLLMYPIEGLQYNLFKVNSESLKIDSLGQIPKGFYLQNSDSSFLIYGTSFLNEYHIYSNNLDSIYLFNEEFTLSTVLTSNNKYAIVETRTRDSLHQTHYQLQKLFLKEKKLELVRNLIIPKQYDSEFSPYFSKLIMTPDSNLVGIITENYGEYNYSYRLVKYNLSNDSIQQLTGNANDGLVFINDYAMKGNVYTLNYRTNYNWGQLNLLDFENDTMIFCDIMEDLTNEYECDESPCGSRFMTRFKKTPDVCFWTGIVSSDWYNEQNWKFNHIPDSSSSVFINGLTPFDPIIDTIIKCNHLSISKEAKFFINERGSYTSNSLSNFGKIEIYSTDRLRASAIFSSRSDQDNIELYNISQIDSINQVLAVPSQLKTINKSLDFQIFQFENDWVLQESFPYYHNSNEAIKIVSKDNAFTFNGLYNSGIQSLQIPQLNQASLYPLPNPYPSSIDWQKADLSSLTHKAFYFFNEKDSSFSAFVDGLGNRSPLIRPLDAFWVWTDGAESIQLDNASRVHEAEFKEETPTKKYLSLQVIGGKGTDETVIGFNENASFDFDPEYDAFKFVPTTHFAPHIFTNTENELLSVNQLPDTSILDLFVLSGEDETLKIELAENNGFDFLVLEDLIWNTRIDLLKNDYSFDYFKSDGHYPFKLYFTPWALEPIEEVDIQMYYYPEFLVIKSRKPIAYAEITLYDLAGRAVLEFHEQDFYYIKKPIHITTGHYIAQFRSGNLVVNKKILVRK